jgi:hypothetical protein
MGTYIGFNPQDYPCRRCHQKTVKFVPRAGRDYVKLWFVPGFLVAGIVVITATSSFADSVLPAVVGGLALVGAGYSAYCALRVQDVIVCTTCGRREFVQIEAPK